MKLPKDVLISRQGMPLYLQLENILREKISSGYFKPGDALPSDKGLVQDYHVSRVTVRKALLKLVDKGLIKRIKGKGTFVAKINLPFNPPKFTGSIDDLISMGIMTSTKIIDFGLTQATGKVRENLELPENQNVLRVERLRLAQGSPFSYIINYVPKHIGEQIRPKDLVVKPLLQILEDDLNIKLAEANQRIEATIADSYVAQLLEIHAGDPLLRIERTIFDHNHIAVEYVTVLYRADRYYYTSKLERNYKK